jgi:hypothetical protein
MDFFRKRRGRDAQNAKQGTNPEVGPLIGREAPCPIEEIDGELLAHFSKTLRENPSLAEQVEKIHQRYLAGSTTDLNAVLLWSTSLVTKFGMPYTDPGGTPGASEKIKYYQFTGRTYWIRYASCFDLGGEPIMAHVFSHEGRKLFSATWEEDQRVWEIQVAEEGDWTDNLRSDFERLRPGP